MKQVKIYTDGACSKNPGEGGWAAILIYGGHEMELSGGERETTNNRMELKAVIEALSRLKESCQVTVYSDSSYVVNSITKGWAVSWRKNDWKKADKKPAINCDLWEALLNLLEKHHVEFVWVEGHAENEYNNRCDKLAVLEWKKLK